MERNFNLEAAAFTGQIDLAAERLGGKALLASDEFFAGKENLLKSGRSIFIADKYTEQGKWMDGWETRRKRVAGYDWCIIKLGVAGVIAGVDIDTNHFLGNHPPFASLEALYLEDEGGDPGDLAARTDWQEILPKVALKQGSQNIFAVQSQERWSHIRLNIYPDGGVARLRVFGSVFRDWSKQDPQALIDLAAIEHGGFVVAANDMFFGNKDNMIMPGRGINMGDGWETRRRRGPGHDFAIVRLANRGLIKKIEVDTAHYKGNYPDVIWLEACSRPPDEPIDILNCDSPDWSWTSLLDKTKLRPDHRHFYESEITATGPFTHVRINIAPDGGISRLRIFGLVVAEAGEPVAAGGAAHGRKLPK